LSTAWGKVGVVFRQSGYSEYRDYVPGKVPDGEWVAGSGSPCKYLASWALVLQPRESAASRNASFLVRDAVGAALGSEPWMW
jgi:hypothetical protein